MRRNGSETSSLKGSSPQETLTSATSEMSPGPSSPDIRNAISLQELADGPSPSVSPDGPTIDLFGQPVSPANRTVLARSHMAAQKVRKTTGTYSPFSPRSLPSASLQSSLESRLRAQLNGGGSTKHSGRWKTLVTPAGRPLCQLLLSARDMSENGFVGWPTPAARDGRDISRSNAFLSQRQRHSPSMATRLLEQGAPWRVITAIYCLAMGYPSQWNVAGPTATEMQSSRKSRRNLSEPQREIAKD